MKRNSARMFVLFAACWLCGAIVGCGSGVSADAFTNPLLRSGADPWVIASGGWYYYTQTTGVNVTLWKTQDLGDLQHAETRVVWAPEAGKPWSGDVWAPELHRWGKNWYIYFAADASGDNESHRIYALENTSDDPIQGQWVFRGKVSDATDQWAIDPDLFEINGTHYLLWSGWQDIRGLQQNIYIAQMSDPLTISSPRILISTPTYSWELNGAVNEGPEALVRNGKVFITYSASGCWTDSYNLGLLHADSDADLLNAANWSKTDHSVFAGNPAGHAVSPGHNGFFQSPDGTQDWIIYHANESAGQGCGPTRTPRMQSFHWDKNGSPVFGSPVDAGAFLVKPGR